MTNWKTYKVGDLYNVASGLSKSRSEFGFGYPFVTFKDVFYNFFIPAKLESLANTTEKERTTCSVKRGDIFLTRTSETMHELGMSAVALKDYENATFNGFTKRLRLKDKVSVKIDPVFIGYYFRTTHIRNQIGMHATMTTRASLNSAAINSIEITIPEIEVQKRIGKILKSIDDKIELNRRMIQTLEQMAQTLFRQYFVNGIDEENLPEGWQWGKIIDLFELQRGFDLPATKRIAGSVPVFAAGGLNGYHNEVMVKGPGITTGRSGVIGNVYYIPEDFWPLNTSLFIKKYNASTPIHAFYVLKHTDLKGLNTGSAVPTLNRNEVHTLEVLVPAKEAILKFEDEAKLLFQKIRHNEKEISTLTQLRDTLLPKLMSGEIDVMQIKTEELHEPVLS